MFRLIVSSTLAVVFFTAFTAAAPGRIKQHGRATVEYRSEDVTAVASYDYSQRNHQGSWLLIKFAVQATPRIAVHRHEIVVIRPDEQVVPLATQPQFLDDQPALLALNQNAAIFDRELSSYFTAPVNRTINFFSPPGRTVSESFVTNLDDVASGNLLFKSPTGSWPAGTYRLVLKHGQAMAELPITLN
jgi:hypothetical protein